MTGILTFRKYVSAKNICIKKNINVSENKYMYQDKIYVSGKNIDVSEKIYMYQEKMYVSEKLCIRKNMNVSGKIHV